MSDVLTLMVQAGLVGTVVVVSLSMLVEKVRG